MERWQYGLLSEQSAYFVDGSWTTENPNRHNVMQAVMWVVDTAQGRQILGYSTAYGPQAGLDSRDLPKLSPWDALDAVGLEGWIASPTNVRVLGYFLRRPVPHA